jgi:lysophospholipase L1-like esterase
VRPFSLILCIAGTLPAAPARAAEPFELKEGDRVVLLGNTLIEREQRDGYWEAALTRRYPGRTVVFRNLGWSGDTVFGHARAGFGTTADGFTHLKEHVLSVKPTVILIGYGSNESFDGPAGLSKFREGLNTLLDALAPARARVVLLSPLRQEDLGRPMPEPAEQNKNLRLYADAIRDVAKERDLRFVDLFDLLDGGKSDPPAPLTDNGIHLTALGYWRSAPVLEKGLRLSEPRWCIEVVADTPSTKAEGARVESIERLPLRFRVRDDVLPPSPPPADPSARSSTLAGGRTLRVRGLPAGKYTLSVDGRSLFTATGDEWAAGVSLHRGPEFEQSEHLRRAIVEKNRLYFHRWRPQNETYLFGFRKGEQGKNAVEVPRFDPLVAKQEEEIARLRVPVAHEYELKAEAK